MSWNWLLEGRRELYRVRSTDRTKPAMAQLRNRGLAGKVVVSTSQKPIAPEQTKRLKLISSVTFVKPPGLSFPPKRNNTIRVFARGMPGSIHDIARLVGHEAKSRFLRVESASAVLVGDRNAYEPDAANHTGFNQPPAPKEGVRVYAGAY